MTFDELLNLVASDPNIGVCTDSRDVRDGDVFVAISGTAVDGHSFISNARRSGAAYIVCQQPPTQYAVRGTQHEQVVVGDSAVAAAHLAQAAQGNPASQLTNLAVTGTNGKTTVAFLVRAALAHAGSPCGLIGTIVYDTGAGLYEASLTTPDSLDIADKQAEMVESGLKFMVIEASSHALSQNRLAGLDFKAAAFTNLTGDHLDYHITEADYLAAKTTLFQGLARDATAVLNAQSDHARQISGLTDARIMWYAVDTGADLTAHIESIDVSGTVFSLEYAGRSRRVTTPLLGRYNVSNHLTAAGLCLAAGFDLDAVASGLSSLDVVPGRLERVDCSHGFSVLIDYAHTDDALKNVLSTLKQLTHGRLIAIFGCGGDRDTTKRPRMAAIAEELADRVIITSDNPRTEDPDAIIAEIVAGLKHPTAETVTIEPDRQKAIDLAIEDARPDDIILIAGKGHEDYQIVGTEKRHFSDKEAAIGALNNRT